MRKFSFSRRKKKSRERERERRLRQEGSKVLTPLDVKAVLEPLWHA